MDPLPLIPVPEVTQNVAAPLREALQEALDGRTFSRNIEKKFLQNKVDQDLKLKENAERAYEINEDFFDTIERIECVEKDIMEQQGLYMIRKDEIEQVVCLKERLRLKHCKLFKRLNDYYVEQFGLLKKSDLLPDLIRQYLDYKLNEELHLCKNCEETLKAEELRRRCNTSGTELREYEARTFKVSKVDEFRTTYNVEDEPLKKTTPLSKTKKQVKCKRYRNVTKTPSVFAVIPDEIEFHNYVVGHTYKRYVKIINTSSSLQQLRISKRPDLSWFSVQLNTIPRIAPGMTATAIITFKPEIYLNCDDYVSFKNNQDDTVSLFMVVTRDIPRLIICIFRPVSHMLELVKPGTRRFLEKRRRALNYTIDCGSCLVGEYLTLLVFVHNRGMVGNFFIITEDEWVFQDIRKVSTALELTTDNFWLYPAYFQLDTDEMIQITVLFSPAQHGLSLEKFYMICDNNSFEQLEILGDAHEFTKDFIQIDVPPDDVKVNEIKQYCIFLGTVTSFQEYPVTFTVHNNSPVFLKGTWKFRNNLDIRYMFSIKTSCVAPQDSYKLLPPYSETDFNFTINVNGYVNGYHNIFFSFVVVDVPTISLRSEEEFLLIEKEEINLNALTQCVDIQIADIEIACLVSIDDTELAMLKAPEPLVLRSEPPKRTAKLAFSKPFLDFGILPTCINVEKDFHVINLTDACVDWKILEVKYNIDSTPHMEILEEKNVSRRSGCFTYKWEEKKIMYRVIDRVRCLVTRKYKKFHFEYGHLGSTKAVKAADIVQASLNTDDTATTVEIEAICIVIYEVVKFDIVINTGHSKVPVLCPLKLMHVGVPTTITFSVENYTPITGCFCFSKIYGTDLETVDIKIEPRGGVLKPMESKDITATLTCKDVGIFENAFVSCFIGKGQEPIVLRVLCAVDGFHAYFYLPAKTNNYRKIMWPPKVVYEYDEDWMICPCTMEYGQELEMSFTDTASSSKSYGDTKATSKVENNVVPVESLQFKYDGTDNRSSEMLGEEFTEISTEESRKTSLESSSYEPMPKKDLMGILEEQFGADTFLQEYFSEMHQVPIRTPTQLTFYFENTTPIKTTYTVEATNFSTNRKFNKQALKFKLKKLDEIWEDMILNDHGVLVKPDIACGCISDSELIRVNLLVYATTWGIYAEEIVVDIPDIPCFTFSLLIEVIGNPVVFPMALNAITAYPTVRFGKVSYCSDYITKGVQIVNTACVPIYILWHSFLTIEEDEEDVEGLGFSVTFDVVDKNYFPDEARIVLMDRYYGRETTEVFMIDPVETIVNAKSSTIIDVIIKPSSFSVELQTTQVKGAIVGHVFLEDKYRNKANYFFRSTEAYENRINMETFATLELPLLTLDTSKEDNELFIYANDIIFKNHWQNNIKLRFLNNNISISEGYLEIEPPFEIDQIKGKQTRGFNNYSMKARSFMEVSVNCNISHQMILDISKKIYEEESKENLEQGYTINDELKMLHIRKKFKIRQNRAPIQVIPLDLYLYFPHIVVKPLHVKFDSVLVGNTRKALVCVYNMTGCVVKFEIYKSLDTDEIFATPHYGEIAKSTGINKQCTNIFVYFTPRQCRQYQEAIRIVTNIPNYYIEVSIKGTGTFNEKFYMDYRI